MLVSIAIPVYRNSGSLRELHSRIVRTVKSVPETDYEIIFTNDGSDDGSLDVLLSLCDIDPKVTVIDLAKNFGQHAANNAAFQKASGDIVINMSADLQDPPEMIASIIEKLQEGYDVALATRKKVHETWFKKLTSGIHYKLIRLSLPSYPDKGFDFWGVNKKAFKAFMSFNDVVRRNQIDLLSIGYRVTEIPYEKAKRVHGKSQYTFLRRLDISLSQVLATAIWPLRAAAIFGFLFTLLGIVSAAFVIVRYFTLDTPQSGWTSILSILLVTSGVIMGMLAVIGEYIWRIYYETKQRPLFFVDEVYGKLADKGIESADRQKITAEQDD